MPELVTTVICAYKNGPDLDLAIQSAVCQSHQPVEVIVVDISSTDATATEVLRRFAGRVRYIRQPNTGASGAYNAGLRAATGEYISFLGGDDVLTPDKIEKQLNVFRSDPGAEIAYGSVRCFQASPGPAEWQETDPPVNDDMLEAFLAGAGNGAGAGVMPFLGLLFDRRASERVGLFDEALYNADVDYELRALWAGCQFRYCAGSPMGLYRIRPGQMSADVTAMTRGLEAVWQKALDYVDREPYRGLVAANLAWARLLRATKRYDLTVREALTKLSEARAASPAIVSWRIFFAGAAVILSPGGSWLARSRRAEVAAGIQRRTCL